MQSFFASIRLVVATMLICVVGYAAVIWGVGALLVQSLGQFGASLVSEPHDGHCRRQVFRGDSAGWHRALAGHPASGVLDALIGARRIQSGPGSHPPCVRRS